MDGERALCEAAKTFGPSTRRLVEKWHARRNIEKDLTDALDGDMESITVLMSLYEKLLGAESKLDADIVIDRMKSNIKQMRHVNEKKIKRPFEIYFDDPSLLAAYSRRCIRCATEALTSNYPAHKATQLFTTRDAIIHTIPKHNKAINLEGYYFFWQETSRRSSSAGRVTVKPPTSCLEFPPFFPPLLGHLRLLLLASSPATSASTR